MKTISIEQVEYYCNAAGDVFWRNIAGETVYARFSAGCLVDPQVPEALRRAYNVAFSECYGYPCYIMTVDEKPYLTLIAEFGDTFVSKEASGYFRSESLKEAVLKAANDLDLAIQENGETEYEIMFPADTDTPFCQWELFVCIPASAVEDYTICNYISDMMDRYLQIPDEN